MEALRVDTKEVLAVQVFQLPELMPGEEAVPRQFMALVVRVGRAGLVDCLEQTQHFMDAEAGVRVEWRVLRLAAMVLPVTV